MKTKKANIIYVSNVSEVFEKIKHARRGTIYCLLDSSRYSYPLCHSELMNEIRLWDMLVQISRNTHNVEIGASIFFRKPKKNEVF